MYQYKYIVDGVWVTDFAQPAECATPNFRALHKPGLPSALAESHAESGQLCVCYKLSCQYEVGLREPPIHATLYAIVLSCVCPHIPCTRYCFEPGVEGCCAGAMRSAM